MIDAIRITRRLLAPDSKPIEMFGGLLRVYPHFAEPHRDRTGWALECCESPAGTVRLAVFTDAELDRGAS